MPRTKEEDLQKHTLFLFEGDYEFLRSCYPDVGAAAVIRRVVRAYRKEIEANGGTLDAKVEIKI